MRKLQDTGRDDHTHDPFLKVADKFEYHVILVPMGSVGVITLLAMVWLFFGIYDAVFVNWDVKNYHAVQVLFGMVMTF
ncbi:hypothetical protein PhaeoP83_00260 [Phaeobacter inhibens]|uniref:Uncharacterized protein n=2 Tax=Phaeobacter inhibens TaxID=221822 RepID=A0ABM6R9Y2_9RHOB|nr:hypothetical protein [Phaeobacter inhibens]AUQ48580.1 hypothetical protein PhaeoP83_00260 [Phaeobacter inhibens]AUQ93080.1 hypothetical protein PhaeoP66_00253 [Phaeobacter inhibens]AUR18383.1 hypothetical protein PhaeoP80_00260 [Phaeobacter inhibens]UWR58385.1 hypothetical protein K4F89_08125 [Phaeobacter inhibens]UWR64097.1 hypothetical protein K4L02_15320 [Phaeobacter inhibens]